MIQRIAYLLFLIVFNIYTNNAQDVWTLERCVLHAQQSSLTMRQAANQIKSAQIDEKEAKDARYPNVSGSFNIGAQTGRTIDPTTNTFNTSGIGFNSLGINGSMILYNGNRIKNTITQSTLNTKAAEYDADATADDLALNIASAYLNILLAEEQLENMQQRVKQTQDQLTQTSKLISAGVLPRNDKLDIEAQLARDEQQVVSAQNTIDINYLNLKQLLELDPDANIKIEKPELDINQLILDPDLLNLRAVYNQALSSLPRLQADDIRLQSAELNVDIAKSALLPRVALFGSLSSNYSTLGKRNTDIVTTLIPQNIVFNGMPTIVEFEQEVPIFEDAPYFYQLNQNFGQTIGIDVSIPIYNNGSTRASIQRAELNILNSQILADQNKQQVKTDIQRAIADAKAAQKSLVAAEKTLVAAKTAYENAQQRYNLGTINTFELTSSKNNYDTAQIDLTRSKYQYLFNIKIVEFYAGRPLRLNN